MWQRRYLDRAILWEAALDVLPLSTSSNAATLRAALAAMGLTLTRASAATVQTSASEVVTSGIGVDDPRVGRYGLVIEEARTNLQPNARNQAAWGAGVGNTATYDYAAGPDGAVVADRQVIPSPGTAKYGNYTQQTGLALAVRTGSAWIYSPAGTVSAANMGINLIGVNGGTGGDISGNVTGVWARYSKTNVAVSTLWQHDAANQPVTGADIVSDLWQIEEGKFATEAILTTGAAATRAGDRLAMSDASRIIRNGRLSMARRFVPKGSIGGSNDYAAAVRLWTVDASNYAELNATTGVCTVVVAGASYSTASGFTWAANDVVDVWIEAGGGALNTVVKARKNSGAVTTLGTSGAAQGTIPNSAGIDLASNGTSAVLTASHQQIQAFAAGRRIQWAA